MKSLQVCRALLVSAALAVSYGCAGPLPDLSPFVSASVQLRAGVAAGGAVTAAELAKVPSGDTYSRELTQAWAARVKLCDALVRYAQSLQDIARAGQQGRQSVDAVASSVDALARTAGAVVPATGAVSLGVDAARFVFEQIALVRAAGSLEAALTAAAPAVDQVTDAIANDIAQLGSLLASANRSYQSELAQKYSTVLGFRRQLERRRTAAYAALGTDSEASLGQTLQQINTLIAASQDEYSVYEQEIAESNRRRAQATAIVRAAADAVGEWAAAHRTLVAAVREKRPVDVENLVDSTRELRELVRRMREL